MPEQLCEPLDLPELVGHGWSCLAALIGHAQGAQEGARRCDRHVLSAIVFRRWNLGQSRPRGLYGATACAVGTPLPVALRGQ